MPRSAKVSENAKLFERRMPQNSMTNDPRKVWASGPINYHIVECSLGGLTFHYFHFITYVFFMISSFHANSMHVKIWLLMLDCNVFSDDNNHKYHHLNNRFFPDRNCKFPSVSDSSDGKKSFQWGWLT